MTLAIHCCGKSIVLEGEFEKVQKIADICVAIGSSKPNDNTFNIPENFGEHAIDVFQYFWNHINQQ